jgi:hypothetical protein
VVTRRFPRRAPEARARAERHLPPARNGLPPLAALVPAALLLLVALLFAVSHSGTLVDTWISLASGRHIVNHGADDVDPFSFASRPSAAATVPADAGPAARIWAWLYPTGWINQKWLTHVVLYEVHRLGGDGALLLFKVVLYALVAVALLATARARGAPWLQAAAAAALALVVSRGYLEIRAQDVTNLFVAVLMLVLALGGQGRKRVSWWLPPLFTLWCNAHGGFIFGFLLGLIFVAATAVEGGISRHLEGERRAVVRHTSAALITSLAAAVTLSPYRLANVTHPFGITAGADASLWRTVVEWRPSWQGSTAVVVPLAFFVLAVVAAAAVAALRHARTGAEAPAWRDMALAAVALLLAVRSLRFVPVAAIVCAPFLAAWCTAEVRGCAAVRAGARRPAPPWRKAVTAGALWIAAAVAAGAFFSRYSSTYLGPWPADLDHTGALDRMTGRYAFPDGVCSFLAANRVSGRMWVPWEDAGYVLWRQQPDPASGRPPVQVLIDGRAQDAYTAAQFRAYLDLAAGGPTGRRVAARGTAADAAEAAAVRLWVEAELRRLGIWLFDVSRATQRTWAAGAVLNLPAWEPVYLDDEHTLLADTSTPAGLALASGIETGATRFPDAFSELLTRARRAQADADGGATAVDLARRAYGARVSPRAVRLAAGAAHSPAARAGAEAFFCAVADDFFARRAEYREAHGYGLRLLAAQAAIEQLAGSSCGAPAALAARLGELAAERHRVEAAMLW